MINTNNDSIIGYLAKDGINGKQDFNFIKNIFIDNNNNIYVISLSKNHILNIFSYTSTGIPIYKRTIDYLKFINTKDIKLIM